MTLPDPRDATSGHAATLAVILAGGRGARLLDLCDREVRPALHMAGRRRLVDYALQEVERTGLGRAMVLVGPLSATLARHIPEAWGARLDVVLREDAAGTTGPAEALRQAAPAIDASGAATLVVLSGARAGAFDLPGLLAAHRGSGAPATLLALPGGAGAGFGIELDGCVAGTGGWRDGGVLALDWRWARDRLARLAGPDWGDLLALAGGSLHAHPDPLALWRDAATPDAFRRAWLELAGPIPFPLPPETGAADDRSGRPDLVMEAGGLTLTVPRFGARRAGRWTLLDETVVMPGARVAPGARLARALLAPGAIVPSGIVIGEDPAEDARWFRACPADADADADAGSGPSTEPPTILVTAPMLARRAAERMRQQSGASLRPALSPLESP